MVITNMITTPLVTRSGHRRLSAGFTLIELLTVVAVLGITSTLAVAGFQQLVKDQRVRNQSFELFSTLSLARSEAIKRNCIVKVSAVSVTAGWKSGWTITPGSLCASTSTVKTATVSGITVSGVSASTSIYYGKSGRLVSSETSEAPLGSAPSFQISDTTSSSAYTRCVKIDLSGMPQSAKGSCA